MRRTTNYLTDVTVIKGEDETSTLIKLSYEDMPRTFENCYDAFWWAVAGTYHVYAAIDNIYSEQTSSKYQKELRKTWRAFLKWYQRVHRDRNTSAGVFRSDMVIASVIWRKHSITITIGEAANMKFNVELYKKGEENN